MACHKKDSRPDRFEMGDNSHLGRAGRKYVFQGEIMKEKIIALAVKAGNFLKQKVQEQDPKHLAAGVAVFALILVVAIAV